VKTMREYLPQFRDVQGDVGIELEVESAVPIAALERGDWKSKAEGSLRFNGIEFVSRKPFPMDDNFPKKISRLTEYVNSKEHGVLKESPRTSLHVHCNILDDTPAEVWAKITAYWLVENLLTKYCGEEQREGNLFCLRLKDAEALLNYCYDDLKDDHPFITFHNDLRYSGQNLAAVRKFGSLEYRTMRGTTDAEVITTWATNLHRMGQRAKAIGIPSAVLDTYFSAGAKGFLDQLFEPKFVADLIKIKGYEDLIEENASLLLTLAYFHEWNGWAKRMDAVDNGKKYTKAYDLGFAEIPAAPRVRVRAAINPLLNR